MLKPIINFLNAGILLLSPFGSTVLAQTLPIRHGQYVVSSVKCSDAPNAAILVWDGKGFSGAHSSACTSSANRRPDGRYDVATACTALGDGTPSAAGSEVKDSMILKTLSSKTFIVTKANVHDLSYRWCSAK
jgi:hypothetical protein